MIHIVNIFRGWFIAAGILSLVTFIFLLFGLEPNILSYVLIIVGLEIIAYIYKFNLLEFKFKETKEIKENIEIKGEGEDG